jgi:RecA-family ATPase
VQASIAGGAKAKKTWLLLALAIQMAAGGRWIDRFNVVPRKVLYVNLELWPDTMRERINMICEALELDGERDTVRKNLNVLNLRHYAEKDHVQIVPKIINKMQGGGFGLSVVDPVYKVLGNTNENDSGDVTRFMNSLDRICAQTGAALALAMHYGKGNQSGKQEGRPKASSPRTFLRPRV